MRLHSLAAIILLTATPVAVRAQTPAMPQGQQDMMRTMYLASHNQLGVLEYCQGKGSVGEDVIALQKRILTMLPPADVPGLDAAEAAGKRGVVQFGGSEMPIADAAKAQSTTEDAMCKQMGAMLQAQAAQLPK